MKYAIVIPDGCADEPQESLRGRTPLQAADTPAMDGLATDGLVGRSNNVPADLPAGSAVANMSLLGYDPNIHFSGRAPLEAAAQGIELGAHDWAIRCNLVTVEDQIMRDFTADHVTSEEARELLGAAQACLENDQLEFVPGVSYRNLLLYRGREGEKAPFHRDSRSTPPHDLTDKSVVDAFPRGPGSDLLCDVMARSVSLFAQHPVNAARKAAGRLAATNVWLWGLGKTPRLPPFQDVYGQRGKMITAVDLLRGIAALIGWDRIDVPGATGYMDTDYRAKGQFAIDALETSDIVCVHIEAPDEASHQGDVQSKVASLEAIDQDVVAPLSEALRQMGDYRILVSPDHPTPLRTKTHSHGFVPWVMAGSGVAPDDSTKYDEQTAESSKVAFEEGWKLMDFFINRQPSANQ